ncbi:MAG: hypothetical protein ACTSUV_04245 [Candidatus Ranarchaeia archaeon]
MSKASSILSSLKQQKESLKEMRTLSEKEVESLLEQIDLIIERTNQVSEILESKNKEQSEKEKISAELDSVLTKHKESKNKEEIDLRTVEEEIRSKQEEVRNLVNQNNECEKDLRSSQTNLSLSNGEIQQLKKEEERLEVTLENLASRHIKNIESLESELGSEGKKAKNLQVDLKALKFLLENKAIDIPELKIIEALRSKVATNLDFIQMTTAMKTAMIEEVVNKLSNRGIVRYNPASGEITTLKKMDI